MHGVTPQTGKRIPAPHGNDRPGPFWSALAGRLSGGMKQKLGLACTLVRSPELLLLDEPTVGVDPLSRRELWEIIRQLIEDRSDGAPEHAYLDEAERCEHVIVLHGGKAAGRAAGGSQPPGARPDFSRAAPGR